MAKLDIAPSSNLQSADYDDQARTLTVTFHDGRSYKYSGVDADAARGLESAPSSGEYFNSQVKGRFPHQRA